MRRPVSRPSTTHESRRDDQTLQTYFIAVGARRTAEGHHLQVQACEALGADARAHVAGECASERREPILVSCISHASNFIAARLRHQNARDTHSEILAASPFCNGDRTVCLGTRHIRQNRNGKSKCSAQYNPRFCDRSSSRPPLATSAPFSAWGHRSACSSASALREGDVSRPCTPGSAPGSSTFYALVISRSLRRR